MDRLFEIKDDIVLEDLQELQPATMILFLAALLYAKDNNLVCRITSIKSDRKNVNSVSGTHEDGRAIDIGCRSEDGWTKIHINRLCYRLNRDYGDIAAISSKDLKPRAVVYHDSGYGAHLHLQVRPGISLGKFVPITRS